jgi:dTMP kinase
MMMAARAQHVADVIIPALEQGRCVVCDRYSPSTVAYQGYGRGLDPEELARFSAWAAAGVEPDRIVLLSVDRATARARRAASVPDRFEQEEEDFYDRVDAGYAALAKADPAHWRVVDATGTVDEVAARVAQAVIGVGD